MLNDKNGVGGRTTARRKKTTTDRKKTDTAPDPKKSSKKKEAGAAAVDADLSTRAQNGPSIGSDATKAQSSAFGADVRRPDPVVVRAISREERHRMIAEAAYHKSLSRAPGQGTPSRDWYEAEAEIDALLAEQHVTREQ